MDKLHTVKKNKDFSLIIHNGVYAKNKAYTIYIKDNEFNYYRFGISVSKKLGNSVYRNKYKRQMRFIIDKYKKNYQNGRDYIIIMKNGYIDLDFESKEKEFIHLIEKLNKTRGDINEKE